MAVFARSREQAIDPARRRVPWKLFLAPFMVLAVAAGLAFGTQAVYAQRALPGMTVGGIGVGSLDAGGIRDRLQTELAAPWAAATVTLVDGDRSWHTNNADLGVAPDLDQAVAQALAFGKTGGPLDRIGAWI